MTSGCSIHAMIRMAPAHLGHTRGSTSYTCLMSRAHARFALEGDKRSVCPGHQGRRGSGQSSAGRIEAGHGWGKAGHCAICQRPPLSPFTTDGTVPARVPH